MLHDEQDRYHAERTAIKTTREIHISMPLTPEQRAALRARLLVLEQQQDERQPGDIKNEAAVALSVSDQLQCDALDRALVRIHGKSYGLCVDCNECISFARLKMEPQTLRCHACHHQSGNEPLASAAGAVQ